MTSSRHSHRAFNNLDILLRGIHNGLFEFLGGITLLSGHKAGPQLNTGGSPLHDLADIASGKYSSCSDDRYLLVEFLFDLLSHFHNFIHQVFQPVPDILQGIGLESQVTSCFGSLHHKSIRQVIVILLPLLGDDAGSSSGRNDGYQFGFCTFDQVRGQVQGKSGTGEDDINLLFNGGASPYPRNW